MDKLNECDIALSFIGKNVNFEKLKEVFFDDGHGEYTSCCDGLEDKLSRKLQITEPLTTRWLLKHIDFNIKVLVEDGKIKKCFISKYEEGYGYFCNGRPQEHWEEVPPTQQEIRIFKRIMDYVVQG